MIFDPGLVLGWLIELALLSVGLLLAAWKCGGRTIVGITGASFAVRLALGLVMYFVSAWSLPLFRNVQMGAGFWWLGPDAKTYYSQSLAVVDRLTNGSPVQHVESIAWVFGATERVFGASPPHGLLVNAALAAVCVPLGYVVAERLALGRQQAFMTACIIGFWPSSLAWSAQLLKNPLLWASLFGVLAGSAVLLTACSSGRRHNRQLLGAMLLTTIGAALSAWVDGTSGGLSILVTVLVAVGVTTVRSLMRRKGPGLLPLGMLTLAVLLGSLPAFNTLYAQAAPAIATLLHVDVHVEGFVAPEQSAKPSVMPLQSAKGSGAPVDSANGSVPPVDVPLAAATPVPEARLPSQGEGILRRGKPIAIPVIATYCPPASALIVYRYGFSRTGGASAIDAGTTFNTCTDIVAYLPRAFELVFLAPGPTGWLEPGATTGVARYLAGLDGALLWVLFPGLLMGLAGVFRRPTGPGVVLAVYVLAMGLALGFVVSNFGTLFRLRIQVLLPAAMLSVVGWSHILAWLHGYGGYRGFLTKLTFRSDSSRG